MKPHKFFGMNRQPGKIPADEVACGARSIPENFCGTI
jgi:hypothetical protein